MKTTFRTLLAAVLVVSLVACEFAGRVAQGAYTVGETAVGVLSDHATDAVHVGVLAIIDGHDDRQAAARAVIDTANDFKAKADAGELVTVDQVRARLTLLVHSSNYALHQKYLAFKTVRAISDELESRVKLGAVAGDLALAVHGIADDAIEAARWAL
jgi:hypothetical protein